MIGEMLKDELKAEYNPKKIANWAYDLMIRTGASGKSEKEVHSLLTILAFMELGWEFEYSQEELELAAEKMISGEDNPFNLPQENKKI